MKFPSFVIAAASAVVVASIAGVTMPGEAGQYPYPPPYPAFVPGSAIRFEITPKQAEVYADGYFAGIVDEFDGVFQRLHLPAGQHNLTIYREGFETVHQTVSLTPGATFKIRYAMKPLAPGATAEPRPVPPAPPAAESAPGESSGPVAGARPGPASQTSIYGALAVRVEPRAAAVFIDGERWVGPQQQAGLVVQLAEGTHRIEVRSDGYETFASSVSIRRDETTSLNVSLQRRQ